MVFCMEISAFWFKRFGNDDFEKSKHENGNLIVNCEISKLFENSFSISSLKFFDKF
jgi:hypothetical protein